MIGVPKNPADRDQRLRDLARDEDCTAQLGRGACDRNTVVWAHTNTQADQKGMGYKGHDSKGFFACHTCHAALDQPSGKDALPLDVRLYYIAWAQGKTVLRLQEIVDSPAMRPWKREVALRTLRKLGIESPSAVMDVQKKLRVSRPAARARKGSD